jgi:hypothetical protein
MLLQEQRAARALAYEGRGDLICQGQSAGTRRTRLCLPTNYNQSFADASNYTKLLQRTGPSLGLLDQLLLFGPPAWIRLQYSLTV